MLIPNPNTSP